MKHAKWAALLSLALAIGAGMSPASDALACGWDCEAYTRYLAYPYYNGSGSIGGYTCLSYCNQSTGVCCTVVLVNAD